MRVISGTARGTKLETIEDISTRPTLDRVKESLFNIVNLRIQESKILDIFAGSGAIGIEFLSRGSKNVVFCDKSVEAAKIISKNLDKTHLKQNAKILNMDYKNCLINLARTKEKFDIVFIDPPYKANLAVDAVKQIIELKLLEKDGIIIIETDEQNRDTYELSKLNIEIYDNRKYGRVNLIFLVERG